MENFIDSAVDYFNGIIGLLLEPLGWVIIVICVIVGLLYFYGEVFLGKIVESIFNTKIFTKIF